MSASPPPPPPPSARKLALFSVVGLLAGWLGSPRVEAAPSADDCRQLPPGAYDPSTFSDPATCAACHPQHFDEWRGSAHAYSVVDPIFWAANEDSFETHELEFFCVGCHSPVANLTTADASLSHARGPEDLAEPARHGVSCDGCHRVFESRADTHFYTPCADWFFGPIADPLSSAPHGSTYVPEFEQSSFCTSCHNVTADQVDTPEFDGVSIEFTGTEWTDANNAAGGTATDPAIQTCQDCHMPAYAGTAAVGGPPREVHNHQFVGGDVAMVPFPDSHRQYRAVQDLLQSAASVDLGFDGQTAQVLVTNHIVGHNLPTGSSYTRRVWIHFTVVGADGTVYLESGDVDANGDLRDGYSEIDPWGDPWIANGDAVFRQYNYDADGDEVPGTYERVVTTEHNMLGSGEVRTVEYELDGHLPADAAWPVTVTAELLYRSFPNFVLREHGIDEAVIALVPTFEMARGALVLEASR
ncbi:MAG: multiheme c-type cytochrome [Myxococcota bacterium]